MNGELFVSYSQRDGSIIAPILEQLESASVPVWSDRQIKPGTNWRDEIRLALDKASALLFVLSPASLGSTSCMRELEYARATGKEIIPLKLMDVDECAIPEVLREGSRYQARSDDALFIRRLLDEMAPRTEDPSDVSPARNQGYAFISYAIEDGDFVLRLRDFLKDKGFGYWDCQESDRDYHGQLFLEIEEAIMGSRAVFAVISENWKRSRWTLKEYFFAEDAGVPVFLLKAKPLGPTLAIAGMPYIDFATDETHGFSILEREFERDLGRAN